jgi:outer membrane receptor protein involved in Fe transport
MTNSLYYVDSLSTINVPGYYRFDTKLSYELMKGMEVSLVGQNLLTAYHREFSPFLYQSPVEVGRSVYGNVTLKF